jgi:acyl-CoA synthetase (AMP-forming)/AMP-acid ligase II
MLGDLLHMGDLLSRNARLTPRSPGLGMNGVRYTWAESEARTNRFAQALRRTGVRRRDRVGILAHNSVEYVEAIFALARLGVTAVPINSRLVAAEVAYILNDAEATALLVGDEHIEVGRDAAGRSPSTTRVLGLARGGQGVSGFSTLIANEPESAPPLDTPIAGDELFMLLYTSGTTGFPKGVMYPHRPALLGIVVHVLAIGSARRHRVMLPAPLYSAAGFAGFTCAVAVGSQTSIVRYSPETALETIARERITFTNLVPTTLKMLLEREDVGRYDLSSLELLLYGGSPMPEATLRHAGRVLDCGFRQTFATSETGCAGTVLEPDDHQRALDDPAWAPRLFSCGRPQVGVGVRIVGDDWQELPRGEIGEVAVACDGNMTGYWKQPDATAKVLRDGWIRTGDLASQDPDGYVYLVDRKHDMIVSGAFNVYPVEVERVVLAHPAVADCAVIGVPDPRWGEAVTALIVPRAGADVDTAEILTFCEGRLAGYKRPRSLAVVADIPRNAAGKILRRQLREPYWHGHERTIG